MQPLLPDLTTVSQAGNEEQPSSGICICTIIQSSLQPDKGPLQGGRAKWITAKPAVGDKWSTCLQTLEGHRNSVYSVAFSHESTWLASASDHTVKIWDTGSGECLQTLSRHRNEVCSVTFPHDSTRLASASYDHTVKIWDTASGQCLQTLEGHNDAATSVSFSHARPGSRQYQSTNSQDLGYKQWQVSTDPGYWQATLKRFIRSHRLISSH
jgi:WD40 repeat protein